jgi:hypothetical protein
MRAWSFTFIVGIAALAVQPAAAAQKYTWDGLGTGDGKCSIYRMHVEFTVDNGRATGTFQQKSRTLRSFDLPVQADGKFSGEVTVSGGKMRVIGTLGASPEIKLTGYCDFGGPLKST